jgi:nucleotide-binding universal stress UspA family protein
MNETLIWRWLTGAEGGDLLALSWLHPMPAWVWVLLAIGIGLFSAWSYSRLTGSRWLRCIMGVLRVLCLLWLVVLISGPMLVQTRERVEPDRLIWLVDRSGSMNVKDKADTGSTTVQTRDQQVKASVNQIAHVIENAPEIWSNERQQYWYGFDEQAFRLDPMKLQDAGDNATHIVSALESVLDEHQGHPISAVVLISDGRTPQRLGAELMRKLKQSAVSVFTVPVGQAQQFIDIAITQVDAPQQAYANDVVPVRVQLSLQPEDQIVDPSRVKVQLIDAQTAAVLDEAVAKDDKLSEAVQLNVKSQQVGSRDWMVKVIYDAPVDQSSELNDQNNQQMVTVELIDEPIRVLYVDGYPRWEYRYLKSVLMREKSIKSSMFLISADQQFAQEGDVPIARLPQTAEEFEAYDVIIIGDVPSRHFSSEQLSMIRDHVANRGAGLIWIGGSRWTPVTYDTTVLSNLLPMRQVSAVSPVGNQPLNVLPTALAKRLQVLQLEIPGSLGRVSETASGGPGVPLRWVQQMGELKPVTEVLAEGQMVHDATQKLPLITSLRYGAGQTLYVATDDFWRWRYAKGDLYYQPLWTQLVRLLGRERISQNAQSTRLSTAHRRLLLKQNTVVKLTTRDALLLEQNRQSVRVLVESMRDGQVVDQLDLLPQQSSADENTGERVYQVIWQPRHTGRLRLYPAETSLAATGAVQTFIQVQHPDDEMRQPQPDHALLARLSEQTDGKSVSLDSLTELANMLPNRARRTPDDIHYPLWHDLWVYLFFVTLISVEWILRKVCKLV